MLVVAPTAFGKMAASSIDSLRGRLYYLYQFCPGVTSLLLDHPDPHQLAWNGERHEHSSAISHSTDGIASINQPVYPEVKSIIQS